MPKKSELVISDVLAQILKDADADFVLVKGQKDAGADSVLVEGQSEAKLLQLKESPDGKEQVIIFTSKDLPPKQRRLVYEKELRHVYALTDSDLVTTTNFDRLLQNLVETRSCGQT